VNARDIEGNTALHLAVLELIEAAKEPQEGEDDEFENEEEDRKERYNNLKYVVKELLFSGARRSRKNRQKRTPLMLFEASALHFESDQANNIRYILSPPSGCGWCRLTRPIEKVERSTKLQLGFLVFDFVNIGVFILVATYNAKVQVTTAQSLIDKISTLSSACFFSIAIFFYFLTLINPGYVPKQRNFLGLLERLLNEKFYLDYVCVYCENLRPENAAHCNFCHRCVEKFDHHCNFVNNCLGYRNHKYFLIFLTFFVLYMLSIVTHAFNTFI